MTLPERSKATFVEIAKWSLIGALVGGGLTAAYLMSKATIGDDERPPIIVRNGSIMVEEVESRSRGKLTKDSAKPSTWYHEHGGEGPKKMAVEVSGVVSSEPANSCGTSGRYYWGDIDRISALYTLADGTIPPTTYTVLMMVRPGGKGKGIEADVAEGADKEQPYDYQLELDRTKAPTLTSVTLWEKGSTTPIAKCNLNPDSEIRLIQKK